MDSVRPLPSPTASMEPAPAWFRRAFVALCCVSALVILAHIALAVWAQNEIAAAESIVALHSMMLAKDGTLYYANQSYPYTITPYMPVYYWLEAGLFKLGIPIFLAGRLISMAATAGILIVCWQVVYLYTRSRWCAWMTFVLAGCTSVIPGWGTIGRVDALAVFFSLAAFHQYALHAVEDAKSLRWAAVLALAALMTKQTLIAAPAAICVLLWFENRKLALQFAAWVGGCGIALVALLDISLHGRFLFNTAFANINPFALDKLAQHAEFYVVSLGQLMVVALIGGWRAVRGPAKAAYVYLALAMLVLLGTAGKIGSDTNYHLESAVLFVICAAISLHYLNFYSNIFRNSKTWVTLLQLPLLIHMVNNVRIMIPFFQSRFVQEFEMDSFARNLRKYHEPKEPVVAMDFNALIRSRGKLDIEPLIYNILVRAGRIDGEPLRRDIEAGRVPVIMLHQDIAKAAPFDPEIPSLPDAHLAEIRKHYQFVEHVEGPYFGGVYVYKPKEPPAVLAQKRGAS